MDNTPIYIKMSEKAHQVQELWEPKQGDFYEHINYSGYPEVAVLTSRWNYKKEHIWLPHQDQLCQLLEGGEIWFYDICREPEGWLFLGRDLAEERIYPFDSLNGIKEHHFEDSAEKVLLRAVMWSKFDKTWDGNDWVKIK